MSINELGLNYLYLADSNSFKTFFPFWVKNVCLMRKKTLKIFACFTFFCSICID